METLTFVKVLLTAFVTLFPVVNPIGDARIFLALTQQYPKSAQQVLARKIAAYSFAAWRFLSDWQYHPGLLWDQFVRG
jgi:small neutral amino acid transporter SnatA (MarC family)